MELYKKRFLPLCVLTLILLNIFLFQLDWQSSQHKLTFAMLDIGQGDALFIESPTGTQILFDGGPPKKILGQLQRVMPVFDKSIDAVVITNPDADHIGGFLDVLKDYKVDKVFEPGTFNKSKTYQDLETEIKKQNIPDILAKKGMHLDIGGGVVIDILFPDRDVSSWASNDGSIVARLSYGKTSIMLTGDATKLSESIILSENSVASLQSSVLKVGHHGSRGSSSSQFVQAVSPEYAMVSVGKNNKYGHPHQETLDTLNQFDAKIFRTDIIGAIIMKSDGIKFEFSFLK